MKIIHYPNCFIITIILLTACKKDIQPEKQKNNIITASNLSLSKTDGIITVQTGILPPVTPQTFVTNGSASTSEFQIVTSKRIFIYQLFFSATYPLIQSISITNLGSQPNALGTVTYNGSGPVINAGEGIALRAELFYQHVDSGVSGKTAQLKLTHIVYRTDDELYHDFYPGNAGKANMMCLVNNIPHISFQDPEQHVLYNGFKQIAVIKLQGDTGWSLINLPLHFASPYSGIIPKSSLIIQQHGKTITRSDSVYLRAGYTAETVIHFENEVKHIAGKTETLKVYAPVQGFYDIVITSMSPAAAFTWKDGFTTVIPGSKNDKFFKEQTGVSNFR